MHPEWFFSLHYTGRKAEKLQSGSLSHDLVCRLFLDDLRELRAGSVKQEKITQMGDTVGLNHVLTMYSPNNSPQHKRYSKIAQLQTSDPIIIQAMRRQEIVLITYEEIGSTLTQGEPWLSGSVSPQKRARNDSDESNGRWTEPEPDERYHKRSRFDSYRQESSGPRESNYMRAGSTSATTVEDYGPISTASLAQRIESEDDIFRPVHESPTMPLPSSPESSVNQAASKTDINRLRGELLEIRADISAARARERLVLQELKTLGAPVPEHPLTSDSSKALKATEDALRAERAQHQLAKRRLEDIERERRSPFVVPALLKAFVRIADLSYAVGTTTANLNGGGTGR